MADRQSEIPERRQEGAEERLVRRADRALEEDEQIDVRIETELPPPVSAEGVHAGRLRGGAGVHEELLDDGVDAMGVLLQRVASAVA